MLISAGAGCVDGGGCDVGGGGCEGGGGGGGSDADTDGCVVKVAVFLSGIGGGPPPLTLGFCCTGGVAVACSVTVVAVASCLGDSSSWSSLGLRCGSSDSTPSSSAFWILFCRRCSFFNSSLSMLGSCGGGLG